MNWEQLQNKIAEVIAKAYPYTVAVGVGTMTKDVTPKKKWWQRAQERKYADYLHVLILDRPVPREEWPAVSGWAPGGQEGLILNLMRGDAIRALNALCVQLQLNYEYHFAPVAHVSLTPAVIESIKRTSAAAVAQERAKVTAEQIRASVTKPAAEVQP